jgi:hypothetical protein
MTVTEELHTEEIRIGGSIEDEVDDTPAPLQEQEGESSEQDSPHSSSNLPFLNANDDDDDDDDMTVIVLEQGENNDFITQSALGWAEQDSPEMEDRRRNVLLRELQRVQRASFIHFMILCLIPTVLLCVVIVTVLAEDEECESEATECEKEARTFINAFTTRCVCDAITVIKGGT